MGFWNIGEMPDFVPTPIPRCLLVCALQQVYSKKIGSCAWQKFSVALPSQHCAAGSFAGVALFFWWGCFAFIAVAC
jgi:hypothetical protein